MSAEKKEKKITLDELISKTGLPGSILLAMAVSGFTLVALNLLGLAGKSGGLIPQLLDPRPLIISSLGLLILGLTPLLFRLLLEDN